MENDTKKLDAILISSEWDGGSDHAWHKSAKALVLGETPMVKPITTVRGHYNQVKYQEDFNIIKKSEVSNFEDLLAQGHQNAFDARYKHLLKTAESFVGVFPSSPQVGRKIEVIGGRKHFGKTGVVKKIIEDRFNSTSRYSHLSAKGEMIMAIIDAEEKSLFNNAMGPNNIWMDLDGKVLIVTGSDGKDFFIKPGYAKVTKPEDYSISEYTIAEWATGRAKNRDLETNLSRV